MVRGEFKLEINIPLQQIRAKRKGGLINEGGVISSEYGTLCPIKHQKCQWLEEENITMQSCNRAEATANTINNNMYGCMLPGLH